MGVFSITLGALMCCEYGILQFIKSTKEQSEQSDNKANKAATKRKSDNKANKANKGKHLSREQRGPR